MAHLITDTNDASDPESQDEIGAGVKGDAARPVADGLYERFDARAPEFGKGDASFDFGLAAVGDVDRCAFGNFEPRYHVQRYGPLAIFEICLD